MQNNYIKMPPEDYTGTCVKVKRSKSRKSNDMLKIARDIATKDNMKLTNRTFGSCTVLCFETKKI